MLLHDLFPPGILQLFDIVSNLVRAFAHLVAVGIVYVPEDVTKYSNLTRQFIIISHFILFEVYIENEMNLEQCIRTVECFSSAGFGHIHFLGGEPLASPYIFDVIKRAKELGMIITINSNACLLTADVQKKLIDLGVDQFAASLDGCTALVNDSIRGNGTFEKVVSNMKQLNEQTKRYLSSLETVLVFTLTKKEPS